MSTHINDEKHEIAESILLPGDPLRAKFIAEHFLEEPIKYNDVRNMLGYTGRYKGVPVSIQGTGMGMPSIGIYSWELICEYNVQNLIRIGTAGSFHNDIAINDIVLALAASTDSNFSHAFEIPPSYAPSASWNLIKKALDISQGLNIPINAGNVVSCDVFYETNTNWWHKWAKMNVMAVEMEAAALYMNCAYHNRNALAMMTITDHFITGEKVSSNERMKANNDMIKFALDIATT